MLPVKKPGWARCSAKSENFGSFQSSQAWTRPRQCTPGHAGDPPAHIARRRIMSSPTPLDDA